MDELLAPPGSFKARRMFGGFGLYFDQVFFGILDDGALYFKVSEQTRGRFEAEGMQPFKYRSKSGEHALKSYWRVPERLYDEPDEMIEWAREAINVAAHAEKHKIEKPKRKKIKTRGK